MTETKFIKKAKSLIDRASVVSFDIFDTLLLRPYLRPTDLFLHLEKIYKVPQFCEKRIEAEQAARRAHADKAEIAFDQIYEHMDSKFLSLKEKELATERLVLRANPEMKAVWDYAKGQGKRIVITSDMYLPKEFLAEVLNKNGFEGYERFYLSSAECKTKYNGALYQHVIRDLGINASDILHIGDNKISDCKQAERNGLRPIYYRQVVRQYTKASARAKAFSKILGWSLGGSILLSLMARRWQEKSLGLVSADYWENIGYEYGGPVCYGYARWIRNAAAAQGIKNLLFVARDGYSLQRVFDTFGTGVKADYVYAPRFLNLICRLDYNIWNKKQAMNIVEYFSGKDKKIAGFAKGISFDHESAHCFIQTHFDALKILADQELQKYKRYLDKVVRSADAVGVVDTVTGTFSSQKLIEGVVPEKRVHGFYWATLYEQHRSKYRHSSFVRPKDWMGFDELTERWDFLEFLMTSPEFPIRSMSSDGRPVYSKNISEAERIRASVYPSVSAGIVKFAKDADAMFGGHDIYLESDAIIKYVNCFVRHPTRSDMEEMSAIRYAPNMDHDEYFPLFSVKTGFLGFLARPGKALRDIKRAVWRTFPQTLLLCAAFPLRVKVKFPKKIDITIFPRLHNTYMTISFNPAENFVYRISVGAKKE